LEDMRADGVAPNLPVLGAVLDSLGKAARWEDALAIFRLAEARGPKPDVRMHGSVVHACVQAGQGRVALELLREREPNAVTCSIGIAAHAELGQWEEAIGLLKEMQGRGMEVDAVPYNYAISACGGCGRWPEALELLRTMRQDGLVPGVKAYNAAIVACEKSTRWREALVLFQEALKRGVGENVPLFSAAILACGASGQWAWAVQLMDDMTGRKLHPDTTAWNALIAAVEVGSQWQLAVDLLARMPGRALKPDRASYSTALLACARGNEWSWALQLAEEMRGQQLEPDMHSYGTLLSECEQHSLDDREASVLGDAVGDGDEASGGGGGGRSLCAAAANVAAAQRAVASGTGQPEKFAAQNNFLIQAAMKRIPAGAPYSKELNLLRHVLTRARQNDPRSVCEAIESYGKDILGKSGRWLKVAGDAKAEILTSAVRAAAVGGNILEVGAYCGYSATRMAIAVPTVHLASMEVDPIHVVIARNVLQFGGISGTAKVWTGHSKDLIPRIEGRYGGPGELHFSAVFFDQKGSLYQRDLDALDRQGLLWPGAIVVADNVLKPGAPIFLRKVVLEGDFKAQIVSMTEFAMPSEDWMSTSVQRPAWAREGRPVVEASAEEAEEDDSYGSEPRDELVQLDREADRMRERATGPGRSVTFTEWAEFAEKMRTRLAANDIKVTASAPQPRPLKSRYNKRRR